MDRRSLGEEHDQQGGDRRHRRRRYTGTCHCVPGRSQNFRRQLYIQILETPLVTKGTRLKDKVCIITGSGSGMGRAAALLFAAEGAKVVGCDINVTGAESTLKAVRESGGTMV